MINIFTKEGTAGVVQRILDLTPITKANWGKMSVSQMLAHCAVAYEMVYTDKYPKPNIFVKLILKIFVKKGVVSDAPFLRNSKTAPQFLIKEDKSFEEEKKRLIDFIIRSQELGEQYFDNLESQSFGKLTATEWSNSFYKHLDHHLIQFGV